MTLIGLYVWMLQVRPAHLGEREVLEIPAIDLMPFFSDRDRTIGRSLGLGPVRRGD